MAMLEKRFYPRQEMNTSVHLHAAMHNSVHFFRFHVQQSRAIIMLLHGKNRGRTVDALSGL